MWETSRTPSRQGVSCNWKSQASSTSERRFDPSTLAWRHGELLGSLFLVWTA